jgi:ribonuclease HII
LAPILKSHFRVHDPNVFDAKALRPIQLPPRSCSAKTPRISLSPSTHSAIHESLPVPFLIGTDEAGYGPHLGPLTITGTLWETSSLDLDLYQTLAPAVCDFASRDKLFVADSKRVYSGSIQQLETSVLALVYAVTNSIPTKWQELAAAICPADSISQFADQPWLDQRPLRLPIKSNIDRIKALGDAFVQVCESANVSLVEIKCSTIFPPKFNAAVDELGNKATLLSTETLVIVRRMMDDTTNDLKIGCDKHGGRSKYGELISSILTDQPVETELESRASSDYSFRQKRRDVSIRFQAKGESFLPTALASMVSKYVREVMMAVWNEFWIEQIPGLKPTKGYPVDAKRFKAEIAKVQAKLGITDEAVWRKK